jgi:hypothetical protein
MYRLSASIAAFVIFSLPAFAQRVAPPTNPDPQSGSEVLNEQIPNPIRNTPAGQAPLMEPTAVNAAPASSSPALDECRANLYQAADTVDGWRNSTRKTAALKELRGARVALFASDARTCRADINRALNQ